MCEMNVNRWFSAKLRFAVFIGSLDCDLMHESVCLMQASDFNEAHAKAILIGRHSEKRYLNGEGKEVAWNFAEVISLDIIGADTLDGAEVYSETIHLKEGDKVPSGKVFSPEASQPIQTI